MTSQLSAGGGSIIVVLHTIARVFSSPRGEKNESISVKRNIMDDRKANKCKRKSIHLFIAADDRFMTDSE